MESIDNHVLSAIEMLVPGLQGMTAREIAEESGLSLTTVNTSLRRLRAEGKVRILGVAGTGARTWGPA